MRAGNPLGGGSCEAGVRFMPCTRGMRGCRRGCLHRALVKEYRDVRDARDALRESGDFMRMEDDEFREAVPVVTFKQWLIERGRDKPDG